MRLLAGFRDGNVARNSERTVGAAPSAASYIRSPLKYHLRVIGPGVAGGFSEVSVSCAFSRSHRMRSSDSGSGEGWPCARGIMSGGLLRQGLEPTR